MLEYLTYKKIKKHQAQKDAQRQAASAKDDKESEPELDKRQGKLREQVHDEAGHEPDFNFDLTAPVLRPEDESFLEELLASDNCPAPPLPPRRYLSDPDWRTTAELDKPSQDDHAETSQTEDGADKTEQHKPNRFYQLFTRSKKNEQGLKPAANVPQAEAERERQDLGEVLDRLNLSAKNNKVLSTQSSAILQKFAQVFKDLVNGVPTAYNDLASLVEDRDGTISRGFEKLPSSLKKLVMQLPDKITGSLGPEILAAAASSQGIKTGTEGGLKGTAKSMLMPHNLAQLVTKPGAIVGMLRAIVEALKTRWPAFIGMNVVWSIALSLLLFVLWYCHKRGRETRLEREGAEQVVDGSDRIEELPDDPALPAPELTPAARSYTEPAATADKAQSLGKVKRQKTSLLKRS
ncbi:hypothetical protein CDD81_4196 [Ophiocordyceps australis]|uniref:Ring-like domain-containing protein n=1 Tax=Ophiocordyceps australis TaxID=1399860 RepID=A0A2C5Y517_9HYPO|nr:hypothetical protein CDD81_4196 [Ophiocordyceps australis]